MSKELSELSEDEPSLFETEFENEFYYYQDNKNNEQTSQKKSSLVKKLVSYFKRNQI